jgi:8-oxo-dGTP pyrophosphatase MutT (NUDIX family)
MEMGETVEDAAIRETWEELTLEVRLGPLIGIYSRPPASNVHVVYAAEAISDPRGGRETLEFALFAPESIPWNELAFWSTAEALREWTRLRTG